MEVGVCEDAAECSHVLDCFEMIVLVSNHVWRCQKGGFTRMTLGDESAVNMR